MYVVKPVTYLTDIILFFISVTRHDKQAVHLPKFHSQQRRFSSWIRHHVGHRHI